VLAFTPKPSADSGPGRAEEAAESPWQADARSICKHFGSVPALGVRGVLSASRNLILPQPCSPCLAPAGGCQVMDFQTAFLPPF